MAQDAKWSIITIGISPSWDVVNRASGFTWGSHKQVESQTITPAGKALNISRALALLGIENVAAGLWGRDDYQQMLKQSQQLSGLIDVKFTATAGWTRHNITILDVLNNREMHLRTESTLANVESLRQLEIDLEGIVDSRSICVFAGSMPAEAKLMDEVLSMIEGLRMAGAEVVVDTSGPALSQIVDSGRVDIIKPNIEELGELLGETIDDNVSDIVLAAGKVLDKARIVLVSRGEKGAVVVTKGTALEGRCLNDAEAACTVGCGDYLLAGFLAGLQQADDVEYALERALKLAAGRAWNWTETMSWAEIEKDTTVEIHPVT